MKAKTISIAAIAVVSISAYFATKTHASEPTQADLETILSENLDAYPNYELQSLTIKSSEIDEWNGTDAYFKEFEAEVTAIEAQFFHVRSEGGFIFIDYAVQAGHQATLIGELFAFQNEGEWSGNVRFTDARNHITGRSEDEIRRDRRTSDTFVLVGTPAEEEALAVLQESSDTFIERVAGEWLGITSCWNARDDVEFSMTLDRADDDSDTLVGEVSFVAGLENQRTRPGSFRVNANELDSFSAAGLGGRISISHDEWIVRPPRRLSATIYLDFEEEGLIGYVTYGTLTCDVSFERR